MSAPAPAAPKMPIVYKSVPAGRADGGSAILGTWTPYFIYPVALNPPDPVYGSEWFCANGFGCGSKEQMTAYAADWISKGIGAQFVESADTPVTVVAGIKPPTWRENDPSRGTSSFRWANGFALTCATKDVQSWGKYSYYGPTVPPPVSPPLDPGVTEPTVEPAN